MESKKVKSLEVENFKRIEFVQIQPEGHSVIIKGANDAGKSSLTDAMVAALAGKRFFPDRPIKDGRNHGHVEAKIGDFVIRREWNRKKGDIKEKTMLRYDDGRPISSPQTFLDNMFGGTKFANFDPLGFIQDKKSQRVVLLKMIGIEDLLEKIKKDYAIIFSKRQDLNRSIRDKKGIIQDIHVPGEDIPTELISATGLARQITEAAIKNQENARYRRECESVKGNFDQVSGEIDNVKEKLTKLRELQGLHATRIEELESEAKNYKDIDTTDLATKLEGTEEQNKVISLANKQREIRKSAEDKLEEMQVESDDYTADLDKLLYKKTEALKKAKFPVPGLSVDDDNVLFEGMPITQESDSKCLQIAMQIAIAKIPKDGIRIIRMKNASLLDANAMNEVDRIAEEHDVQVFLERVGVADKGGHLIENGLLIVDKDPRNPLL